MWNCDQQTSQTFLFVFYWNFVGFNVTLRVAINLWHDFFFSPTKQNPNFKGFLDFVGLLHVTRILPGVAGHSAYFPGGGESGGLGVFAWDGCRTGLILGKCRNVTGKELSRNLMAGRAADYLKFGHNFTFRFFNIIYIWLLVFIQSINLSLLADSEW